jgi:tRNA (guanine-N7-)-methyltransferase
MSEPQHPRAIRSFVTRAGRITEAQERALGELWPKYGVEFAPQPLSARALFGREAPRTLEIGFGNGEHLLAFAAAHPERDFIGVEVHRPGVGRLLLGLEKAALGNVRLVCHDAVEVLEQQIPRGFLDELLILFPDPWPKKRHQKRRLVSPATLGELARVMRRGAELRVATDIGDYARWILSAMREQQSFRWAADSPRDWRERKADWPPTRYEQKALQAGRRCCYFRFQRM